eukprot:3448096-Prymnesium_polylepis.2
MREPAAGNVPRCKSTAGALVRARLHGAWLAVDENLDAGAVGLLGLLEHLAPVLQPVSAVGAHTSGQRGSRESRVFCEGRGCETGRLGQAAGWECRKRH